MIKAIQALSVDENAKKLAIEAIKDIGRRYDKSLTYHNSRHTFNVIVVSDLICKAAKVSRHDHELIIVAACFHDFEHALHKYGENERVSAEAAVKAMRKNGHFSSADEQKVADMIMDTRTKLTNSVLVQSPSSPLGKILADADLAGLGMPFEEYKLQAGLLFKEENPMEPLNGEIYAKFQQLQLSILNNHRFFTSQARQLYPHIKENYLQVLNQQRRN